MPHERFRSYIQTADRAERAGNPLEMEAYLWAAVSYAARELNIDLAALMEEG